MAGLKDIPSRVNRPDWKVVGYDEFGETLRPVEETILSPNPANPIGPQIPTKTGKLYITIADGRGNTDKVYVSNRNPDKPTEAGAVDAAGNPTWFVTEGPGTAPAAPAKPTPDITSPAETTWVDIPGPVQQGQQPQQQGHRIVDGQLVPVPNLTRSKPADDKTGAPVWIPDPKDPTKEIQVVISGTNALPVTAGGATVTRVKPAAAGEGPTTAGGPRWVPDPSNPSKEIEVVTTVLNGAPTNKPTGATRDKPLTEPTAAGNIIWQDIPDQPGKQQGGTVVSGAFVPTTGLIKDKDKPVAVYGTGPNDEFRIVLDDKGNVISQDKNPNYRQAPGTQLTADSVSEFIQILKPDGTVQSVRNTNRITAGEAMANLMQQAGLKVNAGELSMDDAKNMLTGAVNLMNAQTSQQTARNAQDTAASTAAQNIITNEQTARTQGAQTGAGMLNQRVQAAQGMLGSVLGLMGQGQRSGNMGGGMMNAPAGLGEALVGGIQGWTAELGGGQGVYDTAARMVTAADPQNGRSPEAQVAYGVLTQMLERYQQQTGQPHPAVMATEAARKSTAQNGFVPPAATPGPQMMPWNNGQPSAVGAPMIAGATPFMNAGTTYYGNGGLPPDQPFVAPVTVTV